VLAKPRLSEAPEWVQPVQPRRPVAPRWACSPIAEPVLAKAQHLEALGRARPGLAVPFEAQQKAEARSAGAPTVALSLDV